MKMNHLEVMNSALETLKSRGHLYGPEDACFDNIAKIATILLGKPISTYDAAMLHAVTKMVRTSTSRSHTDNYVDAINYIAFAAQFVSRTDSVHTEFEDGVAEMARKLAPMPRAESLTVVDTSTTNM
jgi:Domain of unknown function (DUF6378)